MALEVKTAMVGSSPASGRDRKAATIVAAFFLNLLRNRSVVKSALRVVSIVA